jgi:hypothetical protein
MVKDGNTNEHQGESPINKTGTFWWKECPQYEGGYVTCEISTVGKQKTKQRYAANMDAFSLKVIDSELELKAGGEDFKISKYCIVCIELLPKDAFRVKLFLDCSYVVDKQNRDESNNCQENIIQDGFNDV